jgi:hypothetical protein
MKVAIMQPYFLPYIGYFQLVKAVDVFVIYDDVNYIKKGWINRNIILVNGKGFQFNIPLQEVSQNKLINHISIEEDLNWEKNLLKTITLTYKKAPFFAEIFPIIENIIEYDEKNLAKFIAYSLQKICSLLSIETTIMISSAIEKNNDLKGQDKIIEICKKLEADTYVNAIGGAALYDKDVFIKGNLSLSFIKSNLINYPQFKNEFIPWLSIIDIMMFNSPEQIKGFLSQYDLI